MLNLPSSHHEQICISARTCHPVPMSLSDVMRSRNPCNKCMTARIRCLGKGLSTREAGRGHATPHIPVETAKCWWLQKIEPNAWVGGKGSCAVCVDLQAVGALEFFGELYSLAKGLAHF